MKPTTTTKAALVAESERLRSVMLADLQQLQISSSRLASRAKTVTLLAASGLALIVGSALVCRRGGTANPSRAAASILSPIAGIGLVTGLWLASRCVRRQRNLDSPAAAPRDFLKYHAQYANPIGAGSSVHRRQPAPV